MSVDGNKFYRYTGGTLPRNEPTYVTREADNKLYQFAQSEKSNRVSFVLAPRQMGKSSLMVRTISNLPANDFLCVQVNLQGLGEVNSEIALYRSILSRICQQIKIQGRNLVERFNRVWNKIPDLQPTLQFEDFLIQEIMTKIGNRKLIIFIDEIQNLINWKLQDSFLCFIRSLSEAVDQAALERLAFVLLGVAKPSDLVTRYNSPGDRGYLIELGGLRIEDCKPLLKGLEAVTSQQNSATSVLEQILLWTGGQPFLTQRLCHLVASGCKIEDGTNVARYIGELVTDKVIKNWRSEDKQSHLQEIEIWFIRIDVSQKLQKLDAIRIYRQIFNDDSVGFDASRVEQWDLLMSGIVAKKDGQLKVANPIYKQVFDLKWVQEKKEFLQEGIMAEDIIKRIYNRDVFVLIDQSDSMNEIDRGREKTRWQLLEEVVKGDVRKILERTGDTPEMRVCEQIFVSTFNRNKARNSWPISSPSQMKRIFDENRPDGGTYVVPTLRKYFDHWLKGKEKITLKEVNDGKAKGAFFIIYIDGVFDDTLDFENLLREYCLKIDAEGILKIIIIGIGSDVNTNYFDDLEVNYKQNKDLNGKDCNIVAFDLVDNMEDIIELMQRKLYDPGNPESLREGSKHRKT
jgi:hypothetical protein